MSIFFIFFINLLFKKEGPKLSLQTHPIRFSSIKQPFR